MRPGPPNSVRSAESRSLEAEFGSGQDGVTTFVPTPNADSSTASRLVLVQSGRQRNSWKMIRKVRNRPS